MLLFLSERRRHISVLGLYEFGTIINIQICCVVKGCDSVNRSLIGLKSNAF